MSQEEARKYLKYGRHVKSEGKPATYKEHISAKHKALAKKEKEPYFGLPHGEKDTPQLRKRFKNYVKKNQHTFGYLDKQKGHKLLRDNSFYEFNKKDYD